MAKGKKLKNLEVLEVSLAVNPANRKKFFLIKEVQILNKLIDLLTTQFENESKFENIISKMEISDEAKEAIKGALKLLYAYKDELPAEIIAELTKLLGLEYAEPEYPEPTERGRKEDEEEEKKEKEAEESPIVKEKILQIMKENEELRERLNKEIRIRKEKDALLRVEKELPNIPENAELVAKMLVDIEEKIPEHASTLLRLLRGYSEAVKQITKEVGAGGEAPKSVWSKIEALAKEKVEKEKITKEQAIAKVLEENPNLYEEYLKER